MLGHALARLPEFAPEARSLSDAWTFHVIPHALQRAAAAPAGGPAEGMALSGESSAEQEGNEPVPMSPASEAMSDGEAVDVDLEAGG